MKTIGVYGGSFDPIHYGHLITAQFVLESRNLDSIVFVPNRISPLKPGTTPASGEHRLNMVQLALEGSSCFTFNDLEFRREGPSYTIDTLLALKESDTILELIVGYDNLLAFPRWKDPEKIIRLCKLIVLRRNVAGSLERNEFFEAAEFVNTPVIDISASQIRSRIARGQSIKYLVPEKVNDYIRRNKLYIPHEDGV